MQTRPRLRPRGPPAAQSAIWSGGAQLRSGSKQHQRAQSTRGGQGEALHPPLPSEHKRTRFYTLKQDSKSPERKGRGLLHPFKASGEPVVYVLGFRSWVPINAHASRTAPTWPPAAKRKEKTTQAVFGPFGGFYLEVQLSSANVTSH